MEYTISIMDTVPREIIELIFSVCDAKVLAIQIPRVSKLFKKLSEDNGSIWKAKCQQKYSVLNSKPSDRTWKQFYFIKPLKLFPLCGFILTKATHQELLAAPGAVGKQSGNTHYVEYQSQNLWIINGKFNMLYLTKTYRLPSEWEEQRLNWDISFVALKKLLKQKNGNYKVSRAPCQEQFQNKDCFSADIVSVVKEGEGEDAFYYQLDFNFNYSVGTSESPKTLYGLMIRGDDSFLDFRDRYHKQECID